MSGWVAGYVHYGLVKAGARLYRNTAKLRNSYLFLTFIGAAGWGAGWYAEIDPNSLYINTKPAQVMGAALFLGGASALGSLLWSFYIHLDESGLTLRLRGVTTRLPWDSVEVLTVTKVGDTWRSPILKIRLAGGAKIRGRWADKLDGRCTYELLALEDFTLPPEPVIALLQEYSNGKVDAQEYLNYRQAVRRINEWLAEEEQTRPEKPKKLPFWSRRTRGE